MEEPVDQRVVADTWPQIAHVASHLIEAFPLPCVLVDSVGRCLHSNAAFERTLPKLPCMVEIGRIRFRSSQLQAVWRDALRQACDTAAPLSLNAEAGPFRGWRVHVAPVGKLLCVEERFEPVVLVSWQEGLPATAFHVQKHAGLTRAEGEVLGSLLRGLSAKAIANVRGASVNTVRAQIMSILTKTGAGSQRELIATSAFMDESDAPRSSTLASDRIEYQPPRADASGSA